MLGVMTWRKEVMMPTWRAVRAGMEGWLENGAR